MSDGIYVPDKGKRLLVKDWVVPASDRPIEIKVLEISPTGAGSR